MVNFEEYINEIKDKPFQWGNHDCYTFAKDIIEKVFDVQLPVYRYYNRRQAIEVQKTTRFSWDIDEYCQVNRYVGMPSGFQDYDIIVQNHYDLECLSIYYDKYLYSVREKGKLIKVPATVIMKDKKVSIIRLCQPHS